MTPILIAVIILAIVLAGYYIWRERRGGCQTDADCVSPNTCQNGKCAPPPPPPPPPPSPEVYIYDQISGPNRYTLSLAAAQAAAGSLGATIATDAQIAAAQAAGAEWCWAGWDAVTAGGNQAVYPMQSAQSGCGSGPGVQMFDPSPGPTSTFGVNLYGPKPSQSTYPACNAPGASGPCVLPFSPTKWSQFS